MEFTGVIRVLSDVKSRHTISTYYFIFIQNILFILYSLLIKYTYNI